MSLINIINLCNPLSKLDLPNFRQRIRKKATEQINNYTHDVINVAIYVQFRLVKYVLTHLHNYTSKTQSNTAFIQNMSPTNQWNVSYIANTNSCQMLFEGTENTGITETAA